MNLPDYRNAASVELARLFQLDDGDDAGWEPSELSAIFAHQLNVPLIDEFEPGSCQTEVAETMTFGDALACPPSRETLEAIKQFAKLLGSQRESGLPQEIPGILYLASIASAWTHLGQWITDNEKQPLSRKFEWAARHDWLSDSVRSLFTQAVERLNQE